MSLNAHTLDVPEVDIIIAGGGTAGCVIASRLAASNPDLSIVVIEGGKNNYREQNVVYPAFYQDHLAPDSSSTQFYTGKKSESLAGREPVVPVGNILGGGSSINFMMYSRGQACDFDSWDMPGWSAQDLVPFLKKLETYHGEGDATKHGTGGPVNISLGFHNRKTEEDFAQAAAAIGYPEIPDMQDLKSANGYQRGMRFISPEGHRQDTAHCYLHPLLRDGKHPNLRVLFESKVIKIVFDGENRACGVEYSSHAVGCQSDNGPEQHAKNTIKARKLVILTCGAFGSPAVLERSGVGEAQVLRKASIPLIVDLPGVGRNYQDHNLVFVTYATNLSSDDTHRSFNDAALAREEAISKKVSQLSGNSVDICLKLRPAESEIPTLGPDFEAAWKKDYRDQPDRPMMLMAFASFLLGDVPSVSPAPYVSVGSYTAYPNSRGSIHISGPSLSDRLDFDMGFLTDSKDLDLKMQVWAYKKQREIMRRTRLYRGELKACHPDFPPSSPAACLEFGHAPDFKGIKDLNYTKEDDKAIEKFIRENVVTSWHSLGTAKMAPRENLGVVDANLNVYGVSGLKVIDMSIVPCNVGANTCNTAIAIGEKGAAIVLQELGLQLDEQDCPDRL